MILFSDLSSYRLFARDGQIGHISDVIFDDQSWKVVWLVVETGDWCLDRRVLVAPHDLKQIAPHSRSVLTHLSRSEVRSSHSIESDGRISATDARKIYDFYGWSPYREAGSFLSSGVGHNLDDAVLIDDSGQPTTLSVEYGAAKGGALRSAASVRGYKVRAGGDPIGKICDLVLSDISWIISQLVLAETLWWFEKDCLISPKNIEAINDADGLIVLNLSHEELRSLKPFSGPGRVARSESSSQTG